MRLLKVNDLIRVGRNYDGGYVISESLMKMSSILLSFGINDDWSFEKDFFERSQVRCYAFDFSVSKILFLERGFQQIKYFFGDIIKRRKLNLKRFSDATHQFDLFWRFNIFFRRNRFFPYGIDGETYGRFKSLEDILQEHFENTFNIFLKVDIEGYEYKILDSILANSSRFHALEMEIHGIHGDTNTFKRCLRDLENFYYVYHIHANNYGDIQLKEGFPDVIEISCVRKDLMSKHQFFADLSHLPLQGLDFPNNTKALDLTWQSKAVSNII